MPKLNIDQFDTEPKVGDNVKVEGEVKSIDTDTGEVEVSYDNVTIVKDHPKKKKSRDYNNEEPNLPPEMAPNTQTLDSALSEAFPNTQ